DFGEPRPRHDDAFGHRHGLSRLERFVRLAALVAQETLKVGRVVYRAPKEVDPALPQRLLERDWIGREVVGRSDRVERLAANEIEERKMMGRSATDIRCRFVPPSLGRQKARGVKRKRPSAPLLSAKSPVVRPPLSRGSVLPIAARRRPSCLHERSLFGKSAERQSRL